MKNQMIMKIEGISKNFGGLKALHDVSLEIENNRVVSLIGPNGAGKSTLFNTLTGYIRASAGRVFFKGEDISGAPPNIIAAKGVARSFQITRVFPALTVLENAVLGCYPQAGENPFVATLLRKRWQKEEKENSRKAMANLEVVGLAQHRDQLAESLGYAQRKLLEIARVLTTDADLILLDEPFSGIFGDTARQMMNVITSLPARGKTVCLIEHNMDIVMEISEWIYVFNFGELIASGKPKDIRTNERVIEAYLGKPA
ncbi:MAG: ABC transporter ATP-binding protein [Bacillota bacterium]